MMSTQKKQVGNLIIIKACYSCQEILGGELIRAMNHLPIEYVVLRPVDTGNTYLFHNTQDDHAGLLDFVRTREYDYYGVQIKYED